MAILMTVGRLLLYALLGTTQLSVETGYATVFGNPKDLLAGGTLACSGAKVGPRDMVCAHRSLPCGTPVVLQSVRTRKVATCVVMDRGPFGATLPNGEIILKIYPHEEGVWRSLIDVSPRVAHALGLSGRERVSLVHEQRRKRAPQVRWSYHAPSSPGMRVSLFTFFE